MRILLDENTTYLIQNRLASGYVVDVDRISKNAGVKIHQWDYNGTNNQKWKIERTDDNGSFRVKSLNSDNYLTIDGNDQMIQTPLEKGKIQEFFCERGLNNGFFVRLKSNPEKAWNIPNGSNEHVYLNCAPFNGSLAQSFYFAEKVPTKLRLESVKCETPAGGSFFSSWAGDTADWVVNSVSVGSGGLGLAAGVAGVVAKAGTATAGIAATGGVVLGVVGVGIALVGGTFFVDKLASGEDDLYISLNGKKVWPDGEKYEGREAGEVKNTNLLLSENWKFTDKIQLHEHDNKFLFWGTGQADDLGGLSIDPGKVLWNTKFTVVCGNPKEGSLYSLTFRLT